MSHNLTKQTNQLRISRTQKGMGLSFPRGNIGGEETYGLPIQRHSARCTTNARPRQGEEKSRRRRQGKLKTWPDELHEKLPRTLMNSLVIRYTLLLLSCCVLLLILCVAVTWMAAKHACIVAHPCNLLQDLQSELCAAFCGPTMTELAMAML
jgi:hypothetical protein